MNAPDRADQLWQQQQALLRAEQIRQALSGYGLFDSTKLLQEVREERLEELLNVCFQTKNSNADNADWNGLNGSEKISA